MLSMFYVLKNMENIHLNDIKFKISPFGCLVNCFL
jgi:hypothetical protein